MVIIPLIDPELAASAPPAPAGFQLIDAARGAWLYRKPYANGSPDFVQVIDLSQGAHIELLHGDITELRPDKGSYGGPDPRMKSPAIDTYWRNLSNHDALAFCVINGGFFYMPEYPTRLAFPLKTDGHMVTEGWGSKTYVNQKLILELWDGRADIQPLTKESLYASSAPDILGGLTEDANKRIKYSVGRTFAGVADLNKDGQYETILFLSTSTSLQSSAAAVLRDFGADKVMMLDGGGSTQLLCRSGWHVRSDRPVPQALVSVAGKRPEVEAKLTPPTGWKVLLPGERLPVELEIRNTGAITWTDSTAQVVIDPGSLAVAQILPLPKPVAPGETARFQADLPAFQESGVQGVKIAWRVTSKTETFNGPPFELRAVVIPQALAERRSELEQALMEWGKTSPGEVEALTKDWLAQALPTPGPDPTPGEAALPTLKINPEDIIWIPALMLPIFLILGILLGRRNSG